MHIASQKSTAPRLANWGLAVVLGGGIASVHCGDISETAANLLISRDQEVALGLQLADEVEQQLLIHPDPVVHAWLDDLGQELLAVIPNVPPEYRFRFQVVADNTTINAFAAPGGQIYFYSGLILSAESEGEVFGVLGHEIGHVIQRHGAQQLVTQFGAASLLDIILGGGAGELTVLLGNLAAQGALLSYSCAHELDADDVGLDWVHNAGWDPRPFIGFFRKLGQGPQPPEFLSTHPDPVRRAQTLTERLPALGTLSEYRGDEARWADIRARLEAPLPSTPAPPGEGEGAGEE